MDGHTDLTGIAVVGLAALLCGLVMTRLRQPAIVGYIFAGILLGPTAAGLVANVEQIRLLAELGVLMLLFMIGLELPVASFMKVWRVALLVVLGQIAGFLAIAWGLAQLMGWPPGFTVLLAFAAALSSTAVAIKMLEDIGERDTQTGRMSVAVLIAQDLAVVPMMLIVSGMAGNGVTTEVVGKVLLSGVLLTGLIVFFARKGPVSLPFAERIAAHPELRPVAAVACCLAAASAAGLFGLSAAYGAFLVGLVLGNVKGADGLTQAAKPIEGLLMMVFFLSVGLLIDLNFIWANIGQVLSWLAVVTVVKTVLNITLFRLLGEAWPRAFLAGVLLGQIGEFSFLLAALGGSAGIVPPDQAPLLVTVVALSLLISPLWLATARRLHHVTARRGATLGTVLDYLYRGRLRHTAVQVGPYARAAVNSAVNGAGNIARKTRARLSRRRKAGANDNAGSPRTSGADKAAAESAPPKAVPAEPAAAEVPASDAPAADAPATATDVEVLPPEVAPEGGGDRNRA
ncbi:MAG: cation/H(+) antiporter [Alphaproteobacteria bacterium]|nr:cation/H(+) antiporter [Alphaproteobacteria bacterium]